VWGSVDTEGREGMPRCSVSFSLVESMGKGSFVGFLRGDAEAQWFLSWMRIFRMQSA